MANEIDDYKRRRESEAARLIADGQIDVGTVRDLLILSCHSSPLAEEYFEKRLDDERLLNVLLKLALEDYSGDAQMTASYLVSRFPVNMLVPHTAVLEMVAANEWDSVSCHAKRALDAVAQQRLN